jgi:uncharacterized membrane protein
MDLSKTQASLAVSVTAAIAAAVIVSTLILLKDRLPSTFSRRNLPSV